MPRPKTAPQTLCEPAQSKRMSRLDKSHFIRQFAGKMPGNAGDQSEHLYQAPAFTLTVRTRQCAHVWTHFLGKHKKSAKRKIGKELEKEL